MKPISLLTQQIKSLEKLPEQKPAEVKIEMPEIVQVDSSKKWAFDILSAPTANNEHARKWAEMVLRK
jgi:hypothetical protein